MADYIIPQNSPEVQQSNSLVDLFTRLACIRADLEQVAKEADEAAAAGALAQAPVHALRETGRRLHTVMVSLSASLSIDELIEAYTTAGDRERRIKRLETGRWLTDLALDTLGGDR